MKEELKQKMIGVIGTHSNALIESIAEKCAQVAIDYYKERDQAFSMSGVSEWISVETPPHDQETVLLIDSYNQVSTGYFHGPKSGFIWDAPDLNDPIKWKRIVK